VDVCVSLYEDDALVLMLWAFAGAKLSYLLMVLSRENDVMIVRKSGETKTN
jgi:hypothetical protein